MKKHILILAFLAVLGLGACTDNQTKEQVNDETKEIDAQSKTLGEDIDENDPDEVGKSDPVGDTLENK
ncbi:hypothetical protein GCM10009122_34190 [Fulvivirga kasyanovii]|uniref:Uncharacterized protein n=1 Tax=Fulvivirga kasyanovii TaxID=396812 RepID=A0ABW9RVT7_9BACT|nr:hypothetical protein [Fulvivirga kasyanovii]MTI27364.1 hypothetical protein [Fulvivirga kasyanovii]